MISRKRGFRAMVCGLLVAAGLALTPAAFARTHVDVGIAAPGVNIGYYGGHHSHGYVGVGGYYGGYYAPSYYYDPYYAPVVYDDYYYGPRVYYRYGHPYYYHHGYRHHGYRHW